MIIGKIATMEALILDGSDEKDQVLIKSMGGEIWHDLVLFAVERGY